MTQSCRSQSAAGDAWAHGEHHLLPLGGCMCSEALAGQYQEYKTRRSVAMETVRDEDLFTSHFCMRSPGSQNNIKVWGQSPLCMVTTSGLWTPDKFLCTLNGQTRRLPYSLADGVYPKLSIVARPFPHVANRTLRRGT